MKLLNKIALRFVLALAAMSLISGCGGGGTSVTTNTAQDIAIQLIADYARDGEIPPLVQDYIDAGIEDGVSVQNINYVNAIVAGLTYEDVDTEAKIQALIDSLDDTAPVIRVVGANPATTIEGRSYHDQGATALDDRDGVVSVTRSGKVDTNTIGEYTVTYSAKDSAGNIALPKTRVVQVVANTRPVANAGADIDLFFGDTVHLDGFASSDSDGDTLTYSWSIVIAPLYSVATLSDPSSVNPSFLPDMRGDYTIRLEVRDGYLSSTADIVIATVNNHKPIAVAESNVSTLLAGGSVALDGLSSSDADSDPLDYNWTLTTPAGSGAVLSDNLIAKPTFDTDKVGEYVLELVVNDGIDDSIASSITVTALNNKPIADAGSDSSVVNKVAVSLDGSASSDIDGDSLDYNWTIITKPVGSTVTIPSVQNPTFTTDKKGDYNISLIVYDGSDYSDADYVTLIATNNTPIADAGVPQTVSTHIVPLDGSASSDIDGDSLDFAWSIVSTPAGSTDANISNGGDDTNATPIFNPDIKGDYTIRLIVNDGEIDSNESNVTITVLNATPIANAGVDQNVSAQTPISLDGSSSSDADGDTLHYKWRFVSKPAGSSATLSEDNVSNPTFFFFFLGEYELGLIVDDSEVNSTEDTMIVRAANNPPVAHAGSDASILNKTPVDLNGSLSHDIDSDAITYSWSIASGPSLTATLTNETTTYPTFTPDRKGDYIISLVVNDGTDDSNESNITISSTNNTPIAVAGADQNVSSRAEVTLDGTASSDIDDEDNLTYRWSIATSPTASTTATITNGGNDHNATPLFSPDVKGIYTIQLIVNDGTVDSNESNVTIRVANAIPVADAGSNQSVYYGDTVDLNGSASYDNDDDNLTYTWILVTPAGSSSTLSEDNISNPTLVPDIEGNYTLQLIVNDGEVDSNESNITIVANDYKYSINKTKVYSDFNGSAILDMELSSDGHTLYAAVAIGNTVKIKSHDDAVEQGLTILDLDTNATTHIDAGCMAYSVKLSKDESKAYISSGNTGNGTDDTNITIIDINTATIDSRVAIDDDSFGIAVSDDNETLYVAGGVVGVAEVNVSDLTHTATLGFEADDAIATSLSDDESKLFVGEGDSGLHTYSFADNNYTTISASNLYVLDFDISSDEQTAYAAMGNSNSDGKSGVAIIDLASGVMAIKEFDDPFKWTTQVKVTDDKKLLFVSARYDNNTRNLYIVDLEDGNQVSSKGNSQPECESPRSVEISPDGSKVYLGCSYGTIIEYSLTKVDI